MLAEMVLNTTIAILNTNHMTQPSFLPYARQSINNEDIDAVSNALKGSNITRGDIVDTFEQKIAEYCNVPYAVAFNSGTSALQAACHAAQVGSFDRIITTPNSFVATLSAGLLHNAKPIFVDIDRSTGNLDLQHLSQILRQTRSSRGRSVILPVHFSGIPVDMEQLDRTIIDPETIVIEDAAHALGSKFKDGSKVGNCAWSQMTVLSFHPAKTITTGEGGMVLTSDEDLFHRLKRFRNNGIEKDPAYLEAELADYFPGYYEVAEMTGNYNFTDIQAALGLSQLKRIDSFIHKRQTLMEAYRRFLGDLPDFEFFNFAAHERTAYHLCVVQIDFSAYNTTRESVMEQLKNKGIGSQVHYIPLYRHPFFYKKFGNLAEDFPQMEMYYSRALTLPLYVDLEIADIERISYVLRDILVEERRKRHKKK